MQYWGAAGPGGRPFVGVVVDGVDVCEGEEGGEGGLFGGLAGEEFRGGEGEDDADGEGRVVREGGEDLRELDGCNGTAAGEEEVLF